jgi:hypothetical protein
MPTPRRGVSGAKLSIELLPSTISPVSTNVNTPVVSAQISTVGSISNFYIQLIPSKPVEKFEPLPMSYVLLTNGRITLTGEFTVQPTKECQSKSQRSIKPEGQAPPTCVFNGTLPIQITSLMVPYSTLLVYTFQPSFGFNVAESYRFSVAGLFQNPLVLNATIVPFTQISTIPQDYDDHLVEDYSSPEYVDLTLVPISSRAQDKTRVQLSFTGTPGSTVGLNVIEYDAVVQGLTNEITKERVLQYLTTYEQVPIVGMPTLPSPPGVPPGLHTKRGVGLDDDTYSTTPEYSDIFSTTPFTSGDHDETITSQKKRGTILPPNTVLNQPVRPMQTRTVLSEEQEQQHILQEHMVI